MAPEPELLCPTLLSSVPSAKLESLLCLAVFVVCSGGTAACYGENSGALGCENGPLVPSKQPLSGTRRISSWPCVLSAHALWLGPLRGHHRVASHFFLLSWSPVLSSLPWRHTMAGKSSFSNKLS